MPKITKQNVFYFDLSLNAIFASKITQDRYLYKILSEYFNVINVFCEV